eukprot:766643-Hanusia_phi.AAC.5
MFSSVFPTDGPGLQGIEQWAPVGNNQSPPCASVRGCFKRQSESELNMMVRSTTQPSQKAAQCVQQCVQHIIDWTVVKSSNFCSLQQWHEILCGKHDSAKT